MIKLEQLKMPIGFSEKDVKSAVAKQLGILERDIEEIVLLKQAIDARKKPNICYVVNVGVSLKNNLENKFSSFAFSYEKKFIQHENLQSEYRPIMVGFGPAGMFCALTLSKMGLKPIVLEQGKAVEEREKDVLDFWQNGTLNKHSNAVFGEGGAGTFSDGKLNSNLDNDYCKIILNEFVRHGAPKEIAYLSKPHVGSDNLKHVVKSIREEIISLGGEVLFGHKLVDFKTENNKLTKVQALDLQNGKEVFFHTDTLVLCVGHSARDTFELLYNNDILIKQKPFAMGVRIEQKQEDINQSQYGKQYDKRLRNADYKLAVHLENGRSVFTFCMCPGGVVVASSSDENEVVTNGMSYFARDKENANSAVLVNVMPSDFESSHALAGVYFQQKYERLAFELGGKNYAAPCQTIGSFLKGKPNITDVKPSYTPKVTFASLEQCLPKFVTESLIQGLPLLGQKLSNFSKDENLLIGIESRSSCPITVLRNENMESNVEGIYPCGEGCGHSGGIISSAQDGLKVAYAIAEKIKKGVNL